MRLTGAVIAVAAVAACAKEQPPETDIRSLTGEPRPEIYAEFALTADLSGLSDNQREMIRLLIEASEIMDDLFWRQAYGDDYVDWLDSLGVGPQRTFAELNYGPWDRLDDERPFVAGAGPKPLGANFYPADMSKEEFDEAYLPGKNGLYSLIRRNAAGELVLIPYSVAYADELQQAAELLREAADLAESIQFKNYLKLRAAALISDEFQLSDMTWMDMKDNEIDVVIGPIETTMTAS